MKLSIHQMEFSIMDTALEQSSERTLEEIAHDMYVSDPSSKPLLPLTMPKTTEIFPNVTRKIFYTGHGCPNTVKSYKHQHSKS